MIRIVQVVAMARNGVIGRAGGLPWRISSDLKTFRRLTLGKPVIMGRKTFRSIGKPLDGRTNIVVSRSGDPAVAPGATVVASLDAALALCRRIAAETGVDEVAIIGGAEIYRATLADTDRIYLSEIDAEPDGDACFPALDPAAWQEVARTPQPRGPNDDHGFALVVLDRRPTAA